MITVTISNIDKTQLALTQGLSAAVQEIAADTKAALVAATPIRTGRARAGWNETTSSKSFTVENSVPYIERLENNWSKQTRGRGIIGPALNQVKGKFK